MKKRATIPIFGVMGAILLLISISISISLDRQDSSDFQTHIERLSKNKLDHAVDNLRMMLIATIRENAYEAIIDVGKIPEGQTINPHLTHSRDVGWNLVLKNLSKSIADSSVTEISSLADYSDGEFHHFYFDGINLTVSSFDPSQISFLESGGELLINVTLPEIYSNKFNGWRASLFGGGLTIALDVRLKDMYDRCWDFVRHYESNVMITITGALYTRAFLTATIGRNGPFLDAGDYFFDPIHTLLYADMDTIGSIAEKPLSLADLGAIPLATYLSEWAYLSEPSFLPPGLDFMAGEGAEALDAISETYSNDFSELCKGLEGDDEQYCEEFYDLDNLEARVEGLAAEIDELEKLLDDLHDWFDGYNTTPYYACKSCYEEERECLRACEGLSGRAEDRCEDRCDRREDRCSERHPDQKSECREDEFSRLRADGIDCNQFAEEARDIIDLTTAAIEEYDSSECARSLQDYYDKYRPQKGDQLSTIFDENHLGYGMEQSLTFCDDLEDALDGLSQIKTSRLRASDISDRFCNRRREVGDCRSDSDCEDGGSCGISCHYPSCPSGGQSYDCLGDVVVGFRTEDCRVCGERGCSNRHDKISQCNCRCRVSMDLLNSISTKLLAVLHYVRWTHGALLETYRPLSELLSNMKDQKRLSDTAKSLPEGAGYDVFGKVDILSVQYDKGEFLGGKQCYFKPGYEEREEGVCGDVIESTAVYTAQIVACFLTGGATAELLVKFFPMIFETNTAFKVTETLIDDSNRVILTNLAGPGTKLYTYAPLEFEIYRDHVFASGPLSMGRIMVYVYMNNPQSIKKIGEGLSSCPSENSCP